MADVALGAVNLVLGIIRDEARLLRGVRGDVQFIMDEMESMNDLLGQLVMARRRSAGYFQFRPWMKQVMELAFDSKNCVELYMQSTGHQVEATTQPASHGGRPHESLHVRLRRVPWLPWAIIARHRIADRIRELKLRAREIGERQSRYGVINLLPQLHAPQDQGGMTSRASEARPPASEPDSGSAAIFTKGTPELIQWLGEEDVANAKLISVAAFVAQDGADGAAVADEVYKHYASSSASFECVIQVAIRRPPNLSEVLLDILQATGGDWSSGDEDYLQKMLHYNLSGERLLLLVSDLDYPEIWKRVKKALDASSCAAGSAVISFTRGVSGAAICNPQRTIVYSIVDVYLKKLVSLLPFTHKTDNYVQDARGVLQKCIPDVECMDLILHALHSNPLWPEEELTRLFEDLNKNMSQDEKHNRVMVFCYETLPNQCKNCLWYSTTFFTQQGRHSRTLPGAMLRQWVAQGLVTPVDGCSAMDEAERCFGVLLAYKFLLPRETDGAGSIKSCVVNQMVIDIIGQECPTVEDLLLNNQVPLDSLDLLFSLRSGVQLHRSKSLTESLRSLPASSRMLVTVLDLEGRDGLRKNHLKSICRIRKLKYLSLRGTNILQLPKQIEQLRYLETLDIRQTRVKEMDVALPMLRHLLAGFIDCPSEDIVKSKESFSTVRMPRGVKRMENLEILLCVKVSDTAKELIGLADKLKQLKKLGVVLSGKKANLKDLFIQIDKLQRNLRTLTIRTEQPDNWEGIDAVLLRPPKLLKSLNICGIRGGMLPRIKELHQLAKLTLRDTFLKDDSLDILGMLQCLRYLRLRHHSFAEGALTIANGKFSSLIVLEIEDDIVSRVNFSSGAAPKLETLIWSFAHMEDLSGVKKLLSLTQLKLNGGTCDTNSLQELKKDIAAHHNQHTDFFKLSVAENDQGPGGDYAAR